jgi:ribonuclease T1
MSRFLIQSPGQKSKVVAFAGLWLVVGQLALVSLGSNAWARGPDLPAVELAVPLVALSTEARTTHRLILSGGPFPYDKDGATFFNRERLLPAKPRGYYKEYTVRTPRARNRGARRIVCGGQPPTRPEVCFYTEDHYNSFRRITP